MNPVSYNQTQKNNLESQSAQPNYIVRRLKAAGAIAGIGAVLFGGVELITNSGDAPTLPSSPYTWAEANALPKVPKLAVEGPKGDISAMVETVNGNDIKNPALLNQLEAVVAEQTGGAASGNPDATTAGTTYEIPKIPGK